MGMWCNYLHSFMRFSACKLKINDFLSFIRYNLKHFFRHLKFRSLDRNQEELFQYIQAGEFEYLMPYWEGISECKNILFYFNPLYDALGLF